MDHGLLLSWIQSSLLHRNAILLVKSPELLLTPSQKKKKKLLTVHVSTCRFHMVFFFPKMVQIDPCMPCEIYGGIQKLASPDAGRPRNVAEKGHGVGGAHV